MLTYTSKTLVPMPTEKIISERSQNLTMNSLRTYQQKGETSLKKLNRKEALKIYKNQPLSILREKSNTDIIKSNFF